MQALRYTQEKVDSMLKWGIVFSILWCAGVGSLIAFIYGIKSRKIINQSNGELVGEGRVWWCLIVGGLGILFWVPIIIMGVFNML